MRKKKKANEEFGRKINVNFSKNKLLWKEVKKYENKSEK